jgi:hypothetical protein
MMAASVPNVGRRPAIVNARRVLVDRSAPCGRSRVLAFILYWVTNMKPDTFHLGKQQEKEADAASAAAPAPPAAFTC